jgi:hypothetical protein
MHEGFNRNALALFNKTWLLALHLHFAKKNPCRHTNVNSTKTICIISGYRGYP